MGPTGGFTRNLLEPDAPQTTIYDASVVYAQAGITQLDNGTTPSTVHVVATKTDGNGGIMQYVLRKMVRS
ncbi:hypothetical protein [Lentzea flava]|uniref:hypothetical protein n=1 Tax=Lentzea flava TaxID=103732 RepID=UPI00166F85E0|nr:hypothetical protein [Lentzea flava]MCP2199138.1 hypothetical protein [Lentzea flava]